MGVIILSKDNLPENPQKPSTVDIVAIHGLYEGQLDTWTDPQTRLLWLQDLFPHEDLDVRVLAYGYGAETLLDPGRTAEGILPYATSLIAELCALRELTDTSERPIIFICHGFGGILLKRALAFSNTSQAEKVQHRRSIFVSTHAILFMGTPHNGLSKEAILSSPKHRIGGPSQFLLSLLKNSETLRDIGEQFSPLMKHFMIHYFWEQLDTKSRGFVGRMVDEDSAAPAWDSVDRCGVLANHSEMVKFNSRNARGYPVVFSALRRYIREAPAKVLANWERERKYVDNERRREASDFLMGSPAVSDLTPGLSNANPDNINEIYAVNRCSSHYFTGRRMHARAMEEALSNTQAHSEKLTQMIFIIYGLGGSGKTQFCLKYLENSRSRYWGVFWVDASSDENAETGYASIALEAGKSANSAAGIHWLASQTRPWILVIDNADDPEMDVSKYIPVSRTGHVLVTTRNPDVATKATLGSFRFRGMDPEEAIALLLRAAHLSSPETMKDGWKDLARGIASELGYLALALSNAGATIRRNIYTLDKYLHYYLCYRREMITYPDIKNADDANIITTWEIPFRKIEARESIEYKAAVDIMHIFAFMHFDAIPERIFQEFWNSTNASQTMVPEFPDVLQNKSMSAEESAARVHRAFRVLCDYSIIDWDPVKKICSLHPVVHTWARSRLGPLQYARWLSSTAAMLAHCISPNQEASGRHFRRQLMPHIDFILRSLRNLFPSYPESLKQAAELDRLASVYAENGLWKQARIHQKKVNDYRTRKLGVRHGETLQAQKALADTHWNLFEMKPCIEMQTSILKARWMIRPALCDWTIWPPWKPDHVSYCIALTDLTQSLWLAGQHELSKRAGQRALDGLMKRLGPDDPLTLNAMFNLGRTLHHLRDYDRSYEYLVFVVLKRKRFFGLSHPETLMARTELGTINRARGKMNIAEKMVGNVLETRKKLLGEEHAYTLWSVNDLSKILCDRGPQGPSKNVLRAIKMLEDIIPVYIRTLGEDHVGILMTKANLSRAYFVCGRWSEAADLQKTMCAAFSEDHPDWVGSMCGYIHMRVQMGNLEETETDCNKLLDAIVQRRVIAIDDPQTFGAAETLVRIYEKQGRSKEITGLKKRIPGLNKKLEEQGDCKVSLFRKYYAARRDA